VFRARSGRAGGFGNRAPPSYFGSWSPQSATSNGISTAHWSTGIASSGLSGGGSVMSRVSGRTSSSI
jgi:hypothetical protein